MDNYSLSDIAAASGNDGWGNNGFFVILVLFLLIAGGGNGFLGRGDYGQFASAASQQEILFGQQFQNLDNKMDRLGNGVADATFALNNAINTEGRNLQAQISTCCCENQKNTDALRYDMAQWFATSNAQHTAEIQSVKDMIAQNKIETLQGRVNQLELQNAVAGVVRYPEGWTYNAGTSPFCSCNNCNCL